MRCECTLATYDNNNPTSEAKVAKWLAIEVLNGKVASVRNTDGTRNDDYWERTKILGDPLEDGFKFIESSIKGKYENNYALYDEQHKFPRYLANTGAKGPTDIDYDFEIVEFEQLHKR